MSEREGLFRRRTVGGRREFRTVIKHNEEEYARVESMAQGAGISRARLYERSLRARGVVEAEQLAEISLKMEAALRMIGLAGNNLNQAARVANSTGDVHAPQIQASADMIDNYLAELVRLLKKTSDTIEGSAFADRDQVLVDDDHSDEDFE